MTNTEDEIQKIIRESREWLDEVGERWEEQRRQSDALQRWLHLTHLIDVFENWDEFMTESDLDPEWAHKMAVKFLCEYRDELAAGEEYQKFQSEGNDDG